MIIDATMPRRRILLPEAPREGAESFIPSEGWAAVLYVGVSRRVWYIGFASGGPAEIVATGLVLPESDDFEPIDFAGGRAVVSCGDDVLVFDVANGGMLLKIAVKDVFGVCLTPDGRNLIWFDKKETRIWPLERPAPQPIVTVAFHAGLGALPGFGYEPQSAARATCPGDGGRFHVAVGHYGFVIDYALAYRRRDPPDLSIEGQPRIHNGFVFDPVFTIPGGCFPFLPLNNGYGCAIEVLDLRDGQLRSCPDILPPDGLGYARYSMTVPDAEGARCLVKTVKGWFLWDMATNAMSELCSLDFNIVHFAENHIWATWVGDPAGLLQYALDR